ncbi:unnamed protein product [Echinostoma caproni]|uniref:Mediator of RNA polymerase II transcription subunit 13 n=1 Tax=Echinostoma caproni TaxID=27848 RepID=A0A183B3H0_9TREM|nr:unnamed protein product [Echinostoma caproni]
MVQRWNIVLSAYSYEIHHRSVQSIPHADYLSRYAISEEAPTGDCLLTQPLPMNYIPVQMLKTVQKNPEDLNDYSTKPAVITEDRSFIQAAADVVITHEL